MTRPSEDDLIARYFAPLAGEGGSRAAGRRRVPFSEARIRSGADHGFAGGDRSISCPTTPPARLRRKALGVNVSDLAAKGAEPRGFLLNLALPDDWTEDWLSGFAAGLGDGRR